MSFYKHVIADLSCKEEMRFSLKDFSSMDVGWVADGENVYHEFAKQKLQAMGYPDMLINSARFRVER